MKQFHVDGTSALRGCHASLVMAIFIIDKINKIKECE